MQPTTDQVKQWTSGKVYHPFFDESKRYAESMRVHALGEYPKRLIEGRRPSESEEIRKYRQEIFISPTTGTWGKVFNSLTKIRKASDYTIQFDQRHLPPSIADGESPMTYLVKNFPTYSSIDNWFWSIGFNNMLVDSNSLVIIMPIEWSVTQTEYKKPYTIVFNSNQIIDYNKDEWYFLKSKEVTYYTSGNSRKEGSIYYYIDRDSYYKYTQTDFRGSFSVEQYIHNLNYCPVVSMRGVVESDTNLYSLNRSRLHPILDWMNECVREYSDLQAGVLQSMFPTYWFYQAQKCSICGGKGSVQKKAGSPITACESCKGTGEFPFNPYQHVSLHIKPSSIGEAPMPTPPGGIIEKDTKVISIQDERINKHLFMALKTVNMEHLDTTPLNQSGLAKEWDRSEANNFVYSVAEDVVRILDAVCKCIIDMRYSFVVQDKALRDLLLPKINVPIKFDIATDATIALDIKSMKDAKFNQSTIAAAEVEYISRRFITDQDLKDTVMAMYEIDGLAGKPEDDILIGVTNGWIRKEVAIVHANIKEFIDRAVSENSDFFTFNLQEKKNVVMAYAEDQIKNASSFNKILPPNNDPTIT